MYKLSRQQRSPTPAIRALSLEFKSLQEEPVEGFRVKLIDNDLLNWEVSIFGPPGTLYEGGYFKAHMKFTSDYPFSPPTFRFVTKIYHPNVYPEGDLCISILHAHDATSSHGDLPSETWNPTQSVRTILLSVISLLNEPNISSPANPCASMLYSRWVKSKGKQTDYEKIVRDQVKETLAEAEKEGIVVPTTVEDYCKAMREQVECEPEEKEEDHIDCFYDEENAGDELYEEEDDDNDEGLGGDSSKDNDMDMDIDMDIS